MNVQIKLYLKGNCSKQKKGDLITKYYMICIKMYTTNWLIVKVSCRELQIILHEFLLSKTIRFKLADFTVFIVGSLILLEGISIIRNLQL